MRRHNLGVLLRLLHVRGAASRADLTAVSGLNRSTVRALITELADAGLVREAAPVGRGGAGRPSILVEPRSEHVWALAVDIGVEHLSAARVGLGGVVLDRREVRQPRGEGGVPQVLRPGPRGWSSRCSRPPDARPGRASASAVPGMVGGPDQLVRLAPNLGWVDVPLGLLLGAELRQHAAGRGRQRGRPRRDGRAPARGRGRRLRRDLPDRRGRRSAAVSSSAAGRSTGAGGYAGEVGHMGVNPAAGRLCTCGRRGCWETEVGADAVLRALGAPAGSAAEDDPRRDGAAAAGRRRPRSAGSGAGSGSAWPTWSTCSTPRWSSSAALTRTLFPVLEPYVRAELAAALAAPRDQVRLALPGLGADSSLLGAAELAFAPLLGDPLGARAGLLGRA